MEPEYSMYIFTKSLKNCSGKLNYIIIYYFFQVTHVITTHELLPKFKNVLQRTPTVKHIIFLEDQVTETDRTGFRDDVKIHAFQEVIDLGHKSTTSYAIHRPTKDDPAIIMYTSGKY